MPNGGAAQHILIGFHDFNRGGTERIAIGMARRWVDAGRRVTILCGSTGGGLRETVDPRVAVVETSPPHPRALGSRLGLGKAMVPQAVALAPDVIFLPGNFHFIVAHALRRALLHVPIVAKVSNPLLPGVPAPVARLLRSALTRFVAPIEALVSMAPELVDEELAATRPADTVIREPVLPAGHVALPRVQPDVPLILMLARLEPQKNLPLALQAFALLRQRRLARLLILGEGAERPRLEAVIARLNLGADVAMPGFSHEGAQALAQASALLLTSRYEGYPAVVVEALAADVPVVTTPCTPALDGLIVTPMHGQVVEHATPNALADALEAALDLPFTSDNLRPDSVAHHDAAASAQDYLALFDRLVQTRA